MGDDSAVQFPTKKNPKTMSADSELAEITLSFLEIAFHSILFSRGVYPKSSFSRVSAFGTSAWQNRHPAVCAQIHSLLSSLHTPLKKHEIEGIALVIEYTEQLKSSANKNNVTTSSSSSSSSSRMETDDENASPLKTETYLFEVSLDEAGGRSAGNGLFASYSDLDTMFASALSQILTHDSTMNKVPQDGTDWTIVVKSHEVLAGPHKIAVSSHNGPEITSKGLIGGLIGAQGGGGGDHNRWIRIDKGDPFSSSFVDNFKTHEDDNGRLKTTTPSVSSRPIKNIRAGPLLLLVSHEEVDR